ECACVVENACIPIAAGVRWDRACLIGCAVMTGVGAVINTARVQPGQSVAVFGAGGVGLNVIQGAVLAGANPIIAIDLSERKLGFGKQFGAGRAVDAGSRDAGRAGLGVTGVRG